MTSYFPNQNDYGENSYRTNDHDELQKINSENPYIKKSSLMMSKNNGIQPCFRAMLTVKKSSNEMNNTEKGGESNMLKPERMKSLGSQYFMSKHSMNANNLLISSQPTSSK